MRILPLLQAQHGGHYQPSWPWFSLVSHGEEQIPSAFHTIPDLEGFQKVDTQSYI